MRLKCTVAYDGSGYCGWQSQTHGDSVQEQIEAVLYRLHGRKINIVASGRTDAKVNAWGQVFHFDTDLEMTERRWMGALNAFLPADIRIRQVEQVDRHFHARYCVKSKRYDYRINFGEYSVFSRNYAYQCPYAADIEKMKEGSRYLIGTHDFTSFNSNTLKETPDQVRTVYDIQFHQNGNLLTISYYGHGFLRYMVRMMTAELLEVGRGRLQPEDIKNILEARSKTAARKNAHPEGLMLMQVNYFRMIAEGNGLVVKEPVEEKMESWKDIPEGKCYVFRARHENRIYGWFIDCRDQGWLLLRPEAESLEYGQIQEELNEYLNGRPLAVKIMQ